jgi:hypothetical protein
MLTFSPRVFITDASFHVDSETFLTASFWTSKFEKFQNPKKEFKNRPTLVVRGVDDKNIFFSNSTRLEEKGVAE